MVVLVLMDLQELTGIQVTPDQMVQQELMATLVRMDRLEPMVTQVILAQTGQRVLTVILV
jgi:hypothetical protein